MKIPARWFPYVESCSSGMPPSGLLQLRAEQLVAGHQKSHKKRLAKSLGRRKGEAAERVRETGATRAVREACVSRAGGRCEACGGDGLVLELDHFFGRARSELVETCWMLCAQCHFEKTNAIPGARFWAIRFRRHAALHAYARAIQLADRQLSLLAAQAPKTPEAP